MRLTTKGRYAVTAMLDLVIHAEKGPVSLADGSGLGGLLSLFVVREGLGRHRC